MAFASNVAANLLLLRTRRSMGVVPSLLASFLVGGTVLGAVAAFCWSQIPQPGRGPRLAAAVLTYACTSYFFFHIVHIPVASVRIRVLQELVANGPLSEHDILQRYGAGSILAIRLERLTRSRQLEVKEGRYVTGRRRMLYVAKLFRFAKRIALGCST